MVVIEKNCGEDEGKPEKVSVEVVGVGVPSGKVVQECRRSR